MWQSRKGNTCRAGSLLSPLPDLLVRVVRGWVDVWMGGWVDGWMGGWVDGWMSGWVDGWMDR